MSKNNSAKNRRPYYWLGGILLIGLIVFIPALQHDFVNWDDETYLHENPVIQQLNAESLSEMFRLDRSLIGNYHPITELSFAVNYAFNGLNPSGYIAFNLILHLLNVAVVFFMTIRLFPKNKFIAIWTALSFAIHPMHVESVCWIAERKDVLYTFFLITAWIQFDKYLSKNNLIHWIWALVLFLLSCLSKAQAVVFTPLLVLLLYFRNHLNSRQLLRLIPFLAISIIFGVLAFRAQGSALQMVDLTIFNRIAVAFLGAGMYMLKVIVPFKLSALHPYPEGVEWQVGHYAVMITGLVLALLTIWSYYRRKRNLSVSLGFFWLSILPVLQFFPVGYSMYAERYTYLAYIGLFWMLGYLISTRLSKPIFDRKNRLVLTFLSAYLLIMSIMASQRTKVWMNSETLWSDVIEKYPENFIAYVNASDYCRIQGDLGKAINYADLGLKQSGPHNYLYNNKAYAYIVAQQYREALSVLDEALVNVEPGPQIYVNRGDAFSGLDQYTEAKESYSKALAIDENYWSALYRRGRVYLFNLNEFALALQDFLRLIEVESQNGQLLADLAWTYYQLNDRKSANQFIQQAEQLAPGNDYVLRIKNLMKQ